MIKDYRLKSKFKAIQINKTEDIVAIREQGYSCDIFSFNETSMKVRITKTVYSQFFQIDFSSWVVILPNDEVRVIKNDEFVKDFEEINEEPAPKIEGTNFKFTTNYDILSSDEANYIKKIW